MVRAPGAGAHGPLQETLPSPREQPPRNRLDTPRACTRSPDGDLNPHDRHTAAMNRVLRLLTTAT